MSQQDLAEVLAALNPEQYKVYHGELIKLTPTRAQGCFDCRFRCDLASCPAYNGDTRCLSEKSVWTKIELSPP